MKLAVAHWELKPQRIMSRTMAETRKVSTLMGGRLLASRVECVTVREVWKDGPCRHVVLDVHTRARVGRQCPDCVGPEERETA